MIFSLSGRSYRGSRPIRNHEFLIVGGGAGGIAVAASLLRRRRGLDIAVVEPSERHYYQPGFTLVGAGGFTSEQLMRLTASVMPRGATWLRTSAIAFRPDSNEVDLADGPAVRYPLPPIYWDAMLKGHERLAKPKPLSGAPR